MSDSDEKNGQSGIITLFFILGFIGSLLLGWIIFPELLYSKKEQPVAFNHALHNEEVANGCESCHFFREDGTFSGVPKLAQCVECHEEPIGVSEAELTFVTDYVAKGREVPWLIYSKQPDMVFFSHAAHVKMGKQDCVTCHGHIGESTSLKPYEENRFTGVSRDIWGGNIAGISMDSWDSMKMSDCDKCHKELTGRQTSVQTQRDACFVCHK